MNDDILKLKDFISTEYRLGEIWIQNTEAWLIKIARWKSRESKSKLDCKYKYLFNEKKLQLKAENDEKNRIAVAKFKCEKTLIYNGSGIELTKEETKLLSLGLNFCVAPKKFPLVEHIAAIEQLCDVIQEREAGLSTRLQAIRNLAAKHMKRGSQMKIRSNITSSERNAIRSLQVKAEK